LIEDDTCAQIGGVNPQFFNLKGAAQYAQYDSWLTVGMTNGESTTAISVVGDDVTSWSEAKALSTEDGAIFWMNPSDGPSVTDANGKVGTGTPTGNIVVAQLTVKSGVPFDARVNCQGRTNHGDNWESTDIKFHVGKIPSYNGAPCTGVQKATVDGCLQNCQRCRSGFDALSTLVVRCALILLARLDFPPVLSSKSAAAHVGGQQSRFLRDRCW
jgi:hypothetical protein